MMLPLILWDHAYGRVQDTNELPAFSSQNHRGILYTKNAQSYLMMWGAQCLRCLWQANRSKLNGNGTREIPQQKTEGGIGVRVLNRMTSLGMPESVKVS